MAKKLESPKRPLKHNPDLEKLSKAIYIRLKKADLNLQFFAEEFCGLSQSTAQMILNMTTPGKIKPVTAYKLACGLYRAEKLYKRHPIEWTMEDVLRLQDKTLGLYPWETSEGELDEALGVRKRQTRRYREVENPFAALDDISTSVIDNQGKVTDDTSIEGVDREKKMVARSRRFSPQGMAEFSRLLKRSMDILRLTVEDFEDRVSEDEDDIGYGLLGGENVFDGLEYDAVQLKAWLIQEWLDYDKTLTLSHLPTLDEILAIQKMPIYLDLESKTIAEGSYLYDLIYPEDGNSSEDNPRNQAGDGKKLNR